MKITDVPAKYRDLARTKILEYINSCEEEMCDVNGIQFVPNTLKSPFYKQYVEDVEEWVVVANRITKEVGFYWNQNDYYNGDCSYKVIAEWRKS